MRRVRVQTPAGGWFEPWPVVFELVESAGQPIVLVGGLMTELHSLVGGVSDFRPTDDVDLLVNMMDPSSTDAVNKSWISWFPTTLHRLLAWADGQRWKSPVGAKLLRN